MATKLYAKTDKTQLTQNFNITEFHCKGKTCGCTETVHDAQLSAYLQQIREHFGKPLYITSGYRCPKHNAAVGGTPNSRHTKGQAADFYISGIEPAEIAKYAESIGVKGIGLYDTFVHIDTRDVKSYWFGHGQEYRETFGGAPERPHAYLVTCRINKSVSVHTLVFDRAVGNCIQRIPGSGAAIKMEIVDNDVTFSPITISTDQVEIVRISTLET